MNNIAEKKEYISQYLGFPEHPIVAVSANEGYNVTNLVEEMVRALPKHAQSSVAAQVKEEHKTEKVIEEATDGFGDTVDRVIDEIIDMAPIPKPVATLAKAAKKLVVEGIKKTWSFFLGNVIPPPEFKRALVIYRRVNMKKLTLSVMFISVVKIIN